MNWIRGIAWWLAFFVGMFLFIVCGMVTVQFAFLVVRMIIPPFSSI
jgi:hypothetical protein